MARVFASPRHEALRAFLVKQRKAAGLRQVDLAKRLKRGQDYVSDVERGQKIVNVVELMEWADALGFDPREVMKLLSESSKRKPRRSD
ncbi:MAG TPA: helix-turn-helix transcriptional regulator [Xanthobacteraceae bacterium]|nr:helix-turn-helix transcriptional regulator [Xanthobacteraceae bacterium]